MTDAPTPLSAESAPVVLFDGVCNLCSASVQWIVERDPDRQFRFASLQSESARRLLAHHGVTLDTEADPESVLLVEADAVYAHSDAALHIARRLGRPWSLLYPLRFVPRFVRDTVYRFIARHRYRWFGRQDACWLPTPDLRSRFLNDAE